MPIFRRAAVCTVVIGTLLLSVKPKLVQSAAEDNTMEITRTLPGNVHRVHFDFQEGRVIRLREYFIDRIGLQIREDTYSFEAEPMAVGNLAKTEIEDWGAMKTRWLPERTDIVKPKHNYQVFVDEAKRESLEIGPQGDECEGIGDTEEQESVRILVIWDCPEEDPLESNAILRIDVRELAGQKMIPSYSSRDETTGEYSFNKGLYNEWYGACTVPSPTESDCSLVMTWYETTYQLPCKRLIWGVREDSSRYLHSIELIEYDFPEVSNMFDPEGTLFYRLGLPIVRYDRPEYCVPYIKEE